MFSTEDTDGSVLGGLDALNKKILEAFCASVDEMPRENGTEVVIRL